MPSSYLLAVTDVPDEADVEIGWEKIPSYPAVEAVVEFSLVVLAGDRFRGVFRVAVSVAPLAAGTWPPSSPKLLPWVGRAGAVADVDCATTPVVGGTPAVDDWGPAFDEVVSRLARVWGCWRGRRGGRAEW